VTRSDTTGVEPSAVEKAEIAGLGGNLIWYRGARGDGYSHGECVEIARAGGNLIWYRGARDVGASHGECVDALRLGGNLSDYQWAREVGAIHATIVDAVTVHGLPPVLLRGSPTAQSDDGRGNSRLVESVNRRPTGSGVDRRPGHPESGFGR
jgi:hypothetical protein